MAGGAEGIAPLPIYAAGFPLRLYGRLTSSVWVSESGVSVLHRKGRRIHYYYFIIQCVICRSDDAVSSHSFWPQIRGWGDVNLPSESLGGHLQKDERIQSHL